MKNIFFLIAVLGGFFFSSCEEKDIPYFGTERFVYFDKFWKDASYPGTEKADSTNITFYFVDENEPGATADIIVVLAGRALEKDLNFKLKVVEDMTTALPAEYTINSSYVFRALPIPDGASQIQDTIHIQLNKSERLNTLKDGYRLVLEIVPDNEVKVGQYERSRCIIRVTKDPSKPEWWNLEVDLNLLGTFSPKKYQLLLENIPGAKDLNKEMVEQRPDLARKIALEFKKWLIEHPSYDDDDELITVPA